MMKLELFEPFFIILTNLTLYLNFSVTFVIASIFFFFFTGTNGLPYLVRKTEMTLDGA